MSALSLNFGESVSVAVAIASPVARVLAISEGFSTAESFAKSYGLKIAESFQTFEEFRRGAHGVISDMILRNVELTATDFNGACDSGHAPGYENFRDFVQGNYDYADAAFRVILQSVTSDRAALSALKASADVPDIIDGGECTITNATAGFDVAFGRTFNVAPDYVNVTVKGGASMTLVPEYSNVTKNGMNVKLRDTSHNLQTGTVSWGVRGH